MSSTSELSRRLIGIVLENFEFNPDFFATYSVAVRARYTERYEQFFHGLQNTNAGALWAYPLALSENPQARERAIHIGAMTECYFQLDDASASFRKDLMTDVWKYKYSHLSSLELTDRLIEDISIFQLDTRERFINYTIEWLCFDSILKSQQERSGRVPVILRAADAGVHGWFMLYVESFTGHAWPQVVNHDPLLKYRFCFDWICISTYWNDIFSDSSLDKTDASVTTAAPSLADNQIFHEAFTNTIELLEHNFKNRDLALMLLRIALVLYCTSNTRYLARGAKVSGKLLNLG